MKSWCKQLNSVKDKNCIQSYNYFFFYMKTHLKNKNTGRQSHSQMFCQVNNLCRQCSCQSRLIPPKELFRVTYTDVTRYHLIVEKGVWAPKGSQQLDAPGGVSQGKQVLGEGSGEERFQSLRWRRRQHVSLCGPPTPPWSQAWAHRRAPGD